MAAVALALQVAFGASQQHEMGPRQLRRAGQEGSSHWIPSPTLSLIPFIISILFPFPFPSSSPSHFPFSIPSPFTSPSLKSIPITSLSPLPSCYHPHLIPIPFSSHPCSYPFPFPIPVETPPDRTLCSMDTGDSIFQSHSLHRGFLWFCSAVQVLQSCAQHTAQLSAAASCFRVSPLKKG